YLNFGHGAFFGVGAYVTAIAMVHAGLPFGAGLLLGGCASAALAAFIGLPTLRLRGAYFAIATWAFAEMIRQVALLLEVTGGAFGMRVPGLLDPNFFYYVMWAAVAGTCAITYGLMERSRMGYKLRAIREQEEAAETLGVATTRLKLAAFALSATFPGVLGGIYGYWTTYIHPDSVLAGSVTDQMVVMVLLGGLGTAVGPILGAVLLQAVSRFLWLQMEQSVLYIIFIGLVICVVVQLLPDGLVGLWARLRRPQREAGGAA
ncbi:MAG: branched-chain amino acid ABC transporter permease, partial [candidate division NC10 bacterium]|nr:branched-chain amino acid ABC transporter permease [candidate division NC10 bacterium]